MIKLNSAPTVFFDLGGVLLLEVENNLHKAKSKELQELLMGNVPNKKIFNRAFEFANLFLPNSCKKDWILGKLSAQEIVENIKDNIEKKEFNNFFVNQYEKNLIKYGIEFILIPDLLVELTEIIKDGFDFVKTCKDSNHKIAIISNWDPASFNLAKDKFQELFNLFEDNHIIIPSKCNNIKPELGIYQYAIKKCDSNTANSYFIDDSISNVEGAKKAGIKAVAHENWGDTQKELARLGLKLK